MPIEYFILLVIFVFGIIGAGIAYLNHQGHKH